MRDPRRWTWPPSSSEAISGGLPRGAEARARRSVWASPGEDGPNRTTPPIPLATAWRMATASPIVAPVMTRTAASCWLENSAGSSCAVDGADPLGLAGEAASPEGMPGPGADAVVAGTNDPVSTDGVAFATGVGLWSGPNRRAAPAPVAVAAARTAKHAAMIRRLLGMKVRGDCRSFRTDVRLDPSWTPARLSRLHARSAGRWLQSRLRWSSLLGGLRDLRLWRDGSRFSLLGWCLSTTSSGSRCRLLRSGVGCWLP